MRWEDDEVRMTSLKTSEDTRALETRSVHGGGYVPHPPSDPALWLKVRLKTHEDCSVSKAINKLLCHCRH